MVGVARGQADAAVDEVVIRRTASGWTVTGHPGSHDDLVEALVLADLLAAPVIPGPRPSKPAEPVNEVTQLRTAVEQLTHALAARVVIEQAIGVLAERWSTSPRQAFEKLRKVARGSGRRVHDLAVEVVASVGSPGSELPEELR